MALTGLLPAGCRQLQAGSLRSPELILGAQTGRRRVDRGLGELTVVE